ncbi:NUDIX domain-containing protein [Candidatus Woesebacteria bacterium]|nr:MAG: NUDIX domain-containing protein [Candidatus Woesebacteria bacterium]
MDKSLVLISSTVTAKQKGEKDDWFLVKTSDDGEWEFPKTIVRKGESSVRAAIRLMGEQAGMTARVLEEAGRAGGVTTINDKTVPQRHLYYLMIELSSAGEAVGFTKGEWFPYAQATRKLSSKRDQSMLKAARKELAEWKKSGKDKQMEEDDLK